MFYVKLTRLAAVATMSATLLFAGAIAAEARSCTTARAMAFGP